MERDLVPVWQPCLSFFFFALHLSVHHRTEIPSIWGSVLVITSADGRGVNVCVSEPLSGPCLFSASVSAGVSHAVSETSINIPNRSARSLPADKAAQQPLR